MKKVLAALLILFSFQQCKKTDHHSHSEKDSNQPIHVTSNAGKEWNVFGVKIVGKIMSEDTQGEYSVIITETPPEGGPPKHVHKHEDELFYVMKGTYEFYCGDTTLVAKQGDMVRLPKGIPHHFKNVDSIQGVTMNTITPGGFESFFDDVAKASEQRKLTRKEIDSIANSYGMSFIKN
ncbi:cupin domain-containing protein [Pseudotenacibaculum haliotis]|uniref:Cupin domain-containing protein n=1 Tax=Pseudotenacibaculum haliotis TaxID=1862138 RepID=A0ABW5LRG2_9FLAO